jgi:hypothetical protein
MLDVFDSITVVRSESDGEARVKAKSQTALYFLRSLAAYVRGGLTLVSNWEREGVGQGISLAQVLASGARLVYLMEHRRTVEHGDLSPVREECVSQVVIKARIRGRRKPVYLVQYDDKAQQYQLIGGRQRLTDADALTTMKREIEEELAQNHLAFPKDYELQELASDLQAASLSPTYGAYSRYHFTIFQAFVKRSQLALGPHDRWVTLDELLSGRVKDGRRIGGDIILDLDQRLPGGLDGLRLSVDEVQRRTFLEMVREKPLEWIGLAVGVISLILSILFFLLRP